jgi:hypothetical protein
MEKISVTVLHFYNHPIFYPFMSKDIFDALEDAFIHDQEHVEVPRKEFEQMIEEYLDTLKN